MMQQRMNAVQQRITTSIVPAGQDVIQPGGGDTAQHNVYNKLQEHVNDWQLPDDTTSSEWLPTSDLYVDDLSRRVAAGGGDVNLHLSMNFPLDVQHNARYESEPSAPYSPCPTGGLTPRTPLMTIDEEDEDVSVSTGEFECPQQDTPRETTHVTTVTMDTVPFNVTEDQDARPDKPEPEQPVTTQQIDSMTVETAFNDVLTEFSDEPMPPDSDQRTTGTSTNIERNKNFCQMFSTDAEASTPDWHQLIAKIKERHNFPLSSEDNTSAGISSLPGSEAAAMAAAKNNKIKEVNYNDSNKNNVSTADNNDHNKVNIQLNDDNTNKKKEAVQELSKILNLMIRDNANTPDTTTYTSQTFGITIPLARYLEHAMNSTEPLQEPQVVTTEAGDRYILQPLDLGDTNCPNFIVQCADDEIIFPDQVKNEFPRFPNKNKRKGTTRARSTMGRGDGLPAKKKISAHRTKKASTLKSEEVLLYSVSQRNARAYGSVHSLDAKEDKDGTPVVLPDVACETHAARKKRIAEWVQKVKNSP